MKDHDNQSAPRDDRGRQSAPEGQVPLKPAGEAVVSYDDEAARPSPGKQIHRRRFLPPVPERREAPKTDGQKSDQSEDTQR
jgi:hypothetical protein